MKDEILKRGYVDVKVNVTGMRQSHRLHVKKENVSRGLMTVLESQHYIPTAELVRLAEMFQLPIKHKSTLVFPKGKMPKDFTEKNIEVEPEVIEAEVED